MRKIKFDHPNFSCENCSELLQLKEEQKKMTVELARWKNKCETAQHELRTEKQV